MFRQLKRAFALAKAPMICEWLVFIITFICFPGLTLNIDIQFIPPHWAPIFLIITFNIFDTVGRQVGGMRFVTLESRGVLICAAFRAVFIFFFFMFDFKSNPPALFGIDSDWLKMIVVIIFAFTNGFTSTRASIIAPDMVPDDLKAQVGTYIGIFIMTGIVTGSMVAIPLGEIKFPKYFPGHKPVNPPKFF